MRATAFFAAISIAALWAGQSQAQDAAAGEKVFAKCKACHVADEDKNKVGPSLKGVIGRTAGTHAGFKYSTGMIEAGKAGLVWDDAKLDGISARAPREMIKGTKDGVRRPQEGRGHRQRDRLSQAVPLIAITPRVGPSWRRSSASGGAAHAAPVRPAVPAGCRRRDRLPAARPARRIAAADENDRHAAARAALTSVTLSPTISASCGSTPSVPAPAEGVRRRFLGVTASPPTIAPSRSANPKCSRISRVASCGLFVATPMADTGDMQMRQRFRARPASAASAGS